MRLLSCDHCCSKPQIQQPAKSGSISLSKLLSRFLIYTTLIVLGITWIFPLYWMVTSSLKDDPQIYTVPPVLIPNPAFWNNFYDAWTRFDFNRAAFNSVFLYSVPVTFFTLVSSMLVAYGFARIPWRGRDTLFWICIATMMLPWQVTMVPLFIIFKNLGWINTYWPFVVPSLFGNAYFIFNQEEMTRFVQSGGFTAPAAARHFTARDGAHRLYRLYGSGPDLLVFLHGSGGDSRYLARFATTLASQHQGCR